MPRSKKEISQRDMIVFYKNTFNSQAGKHVLFDLMNKYHILGTHRGDVFKEGQRSVVLTIMKSAKIDLAEFDKLLTEGMGST